MVAQMTRNLRSRFWLLLVLLLATACTSGVAPTPAPVTPTASPQGAAPAIASAPAVSPTAAVQTQSPSAAVLDGQVVFADPGNGEHFQIYIKPMDASDPRRLVTSEYDDLAPSFSPDGRQVIFTRQDDPTAEHAGIFVVNADGTNLHQLVVDNCPVPFCGDGVEGHAWSADGTSIVFTRALFHSQPVSADDAPFNVGLWVARADGSEARQLTLEVPADCSGDECSAGMQDDQAGWSPDGERIVFLRDEYTTPERFALFTIAIDGAGLTQITPWELDGIDPDWSPDGSLIAFASPGELFDHHGEQNIFTVEPDGQGLTQLTSHLSMHPDGWNANNHPSWSPDGEHILFTHFPSDPLGSADIFVMNSDGSDVHVLDVTPNLESQPFWGPEPT